MKEEIGVAARFLIKVVENGNNGVENGTNGGLSKEQLDRFHEQLVEVLNSRFENHWFPDKPAKGQGYRCIRFNETNRKDPFIQQAATNAGLTYDQLNLPTELTIWVDPKEVSCRFGESQGSFCTLASFKNGGNGEIFLDQVNFDEIRKKSQEIRDKISQDMCTRKNGRRGFLSGGTGNRGPVNGVIGMGTPPSFKGGRAFGQGGVQGYVSHHGGNHHHSHHNNHHAHHPGNQHHHIPHHGGGMGGHHNHTPSPAAVSWYNSVNGSLNSAAVAANNNNNNNSNNNGGMSDMFSSSPPNHYFGLAKFSPPKYPYGSPSKWSSPPHHSYGPPLPSAKGDKYHWFNSNKATIKA